MKAQLFVLPSFSLLFLGSLSSCETPGQTALLGAALGGASGHNFVRNAAIGAGAGYLVGKLAQRERAREYDYAYDERSADRPRYRHYPTARPTDRDGFVVSPYSDNLIDVRGIPAGAKVVDPSVDRVFINP